MFNELIEAGRSLLRAQPMNKNDYVQWSDAARSKIGECYGLESSKTVAFTKARWGTPTSADSDPSIDMAQVGANLRRELRILEKLLALEGGIPGRQP